MPPKVTVKLNVPQRNAQRARIWQFHLDGCSLAEIATAEKLPRSTAQCIVKQIQKNGYTELTKPKGRPAALNKTYAQMHFFHLFTNEIIRRWVRTLIKLARKHPFWGAQKLGDTLFEDMMKVHGSMPPGHQFKVYLSIALIRVIVNLLFFSRSPQSQLASGLERF